MGGEGTPPKEDIRPDTKLLWPFLFPQSLLLSVDCETPEKGQRQARRIYFATFYFIPGYVAGILHISVFVVPKVGCSDQHTAAIFTLGQ